MTTHDTASAPPAAWRGALRDFFLAHPLATSVHIAFADAPTDDAPAWAHVNLTFEHFTWDCRDGAVDMNENVDDEWLDEKTDACEKFCDTFCEAHSAACFEELREIGTTTWPSRTEPPPWTFEAKRGEIVGWDGAEIGGPS